MRESADERRAVQFLEFVEFRGVDDPRDHLAHVVGKAVLARHDAVDVLGRVLRVPRFPQRQRYPFLVIQVGDDLARDRQRVRVVVGEVIGYARDPRVHAAAAQRFGVDDLAGRRLHERRPAQEDRALVAHDDGFVAHRGHVGAAGRARAHHGRNLRYAERRQPRLVIENAAEMIAVGEHLVLARQERAARIDEINARQVVLLRNLLRAQVFLHRQRVVGAAFDGGVVGDDHALDAVYPADAADDAGRGHIVLVDLPGRQLADFEKRRAVVEQGAYPVAGQELAAQHVPLAGALAAAQHHLLTQFAEVARERLVHREVGGKVVGVAIDLGFDQGHALSRR